MSAAPSAPFTQAVSFVAKDPESRSKLLDLWKPTTQFVVEQERGTVTHTYEIYVPNAQLGSKQPDFDTELFAFETYNSKDDLDKKHMAAPAIASFLAAAQSLTSRPVGLKFLTHSAGFHSRGEAREAEVRKSGVKPILLIATFFLEDNANAIKFLDLVKAQASAVESHEPACLSYQFMLATDTPDADQSTATNVLVFERYLTAEDVGKHVASESFKSFQAQLEKEIKQAKPVDLKFYDELAIGFIGSA